MAGDLHDPVELLMYDDIKNINHPTHTTKNGDIILISEMSDSHLINTIKLIKRKANNGVKIRHGGYGFSVDEYWYDEEIVTGSKALLYLNFNNYMNELNKRGLKLD